jgi:hypothetical protein
MLPDAYRAIHLIDFNVGAAAAVALLNPLGAQVDALLALGLGPFQALLAAQFNAALAASASLALTISDPLSALRAAIAAVAQLQAALSAALALPPIQLSLSAELTASAALAATLQGQLGGLQLLIRAALAIKIPAIQAAAQAYADLNVGPFFAIAFSGSSTAEVSSWLAGEVGSGGLTADSLTLPPTLPTFGVLIFAAASIAADASAFAAFNAIISVPPTP